MPKTEQNKAITDTKKHVQKSGWAKIAPGLRWIVNGILINYWQTLFQVLVNFMKMSCYMLRVSSKLFNMTHINHNLIHLQCLFLTL